MCGLDCVNLTNQVLIPFYELPHQRACKSIVPSVTRPSAGTELTVILYWLFSLAFVISYFVIQKGRPDHTQSRGSFLIDAVAE